MRLVDKLAIKATGIREGICNEIVVRQQSLVDYPDDTDLMLRIAGISLDHLQYLTPEKVIITPYTAMAEKYIVLALEKGVFDHVLIEKLTKVYKRTGLDDRLKGVISSTGKLIEKFREDSTKKETREMKVQLQKMNSIKWFETLCRTYGFAYPLQKSA